MSTTPAQIQIGGYWVPATCKQDPLPLAQKNAHPRDPMLTFDEEPHIYYLKGKPVSISVTGFIHHNFEHFDSRAVAERMLRSRAFPRNENHAKYHPLPMWGNVNPETQVIEPLEKWEEGAILRNFSDAVEVVLKSWKDNADDASRSGTQMHQDCEYYANQQEVHNDTVEFKYFLNYFEKMTQLGYIPYRTEQRVWVEELDLAGSVDMQWCRVGEEHIHPRPIYLVDWKRSREIRFTNPVGKKGKGLMKDYDDCNYVHYTLQLNTYRVILERYYDVKVTNMAILVFHPSNLDYIEIPVEEKEELVLALFEERRQELTQTN